MYSKGTLILLFVMLFTVGFAIDRQQTRHRIPSGKYKIDALAVSQKGIKISNAIIFIGGSGEWEIVDSYLNDPSQSYGNLIRFYVEENFLAQGVMIVYLNKRGIGQSTGKWRKSGFEERSDDVLAAAEFIKRTYNLTDDQVGLIGHSQGCWIAQIAAARNPKFAFVISLAGPFMDPYRQTLINDLENYKCAGLSTEKIRKKIFWRKKELGLGRAVGPLIGGEAGHWSRIARYDSIANYKTLHELKVPALFVFAAHDVMVPPEINYEYLKDLFPKGVPAHIAIYEQRHIDHYMHEADSPCDPYPWTKTPVPPHSEELRVKITQWLTEIFAGERLKG